MGNTRLEPLVRDLQSEAESGANSWGRGLIVNADDWGLDKLTTGRTLDCALLGEISSVSAMVYMADSERAAALATEYHIDAGLHLNLTTPFTSPGISTTLADHQQKLACWLRSNRFAPVVYHPGLASSFEYVVKMQLDAYHQIYGTAPRRIDGHHHMHLCSNVVFQKLLPQRTIVRRNFSFRAGEKGALNRLYRGWQDTQLAKRHLMCDYFFALPPMNVPERLERMGSLAASFSVEVETHPVTPEEYKFLTEGELRKRTGNADIARGYWLRASVLQQHPGAKH